MGTRTHTVSVRLDPRTRYLAELAARKLRRSLSSYAEWAIAESLRDVELADGRSVAAEAAKLWDLDEEQRFTTLASAYPNLLNYDEQQRWRDMRSCAEKDAEP